jgi:hypothetical protein
MSRSSFDGRKPGEPQDDPVALKTNVSFRYDPRVPPEVQMDPREFDPSQIDFGHLVNAREMARGPAFGIEAAEAGRPAYAMVNLVTNVTSQYDTFNLGVWREVERHARETFSARSDRVTILTGSALTDADKLIDGVRVPAGFFRGHHPAMGTGDDSQAKAGLGLGVRPNGLCAVCRMVREDVKAIAEKLQSAGWSVPAQERIASAAGLNEVRYGDDEEDRRAAELLAADLRALGRSSIRAKKAKAVKARILEVWISI